MELAELLDVRRMRFGSIDQLASSILQLYSAIFPATSQALDSCLPSRTAVFFSIVSITLLLLTFTFSLTLFFRQRKRLFVHPRKFFKSSKGRFLHVTDSVDTTNFPTDEAAALIQLSLDKIIALKTFVS